MNEDDPGREELWATPLRRGRGVDLLDIEASEPAHPDRNISDEGTQGDGPVTELGGGEPPIDLADGGDHRPDRNWMTIILGGLCLVLGVRAVYVGVRILANELDHPVLNWFTQREVIP